jgi:hypothetical protein
MFVKTIDCYELWFGLRKARMYLLLKTPCPFARRRLFVGDRVLDRV